MVRSLSIIIGDIYNEMAVIHLIGDEPKETLVNDFKDGKKSFGVFVNTVFDLGFKCGLKRSLEIIREN